MQRGPNSHSKSNPKRNADTGTGRLNPYSGYSHYYLNADSSTECHPNG